MADVTSLGVHTPAGLPYLINEGILPEDPKKELYQWDTYAFSGENGVVEEETLATKDCVVWSQNGLVRTAYRFEPEKEDVRQVVLTRFPKENANLHTGAGGSIKRTNRPTEEFGKSVRRNIAPLLAVNASGHPRSSARNTSYETSRALVVFLKTKAHVYFLAGSHHIVDLPFEIESVFAAPRGLILQKSIKNKELSNQSLPKNPRPPNNSFFSSQVQPSTSFCRSPTFRKSFLGSQPVRPSPLGGNTNPDDWLNGLFGTVCGAQDQSGGADTVRLYSLTSPFSEVGVVTESLQQPKPRISGKTPQSVIVEFDSLDTAEKVVYVSQVDELRHLEGRHGELALVVTINQDLRLVTVWHGWYIDEQSLSSLIKRRSEYKADKARRRSSFLGTSIGPGTATPIARHRDGARESFAPGASLHVPPEATNRRLTRSVTRKPKKQDDELAMASQMDPDFQPLGSQHANRDGRRISSLVSRGELSTADTRSQSGLNASFNAGASRRHTSFGPQSERRSLGPRRRSRGSTPGSVFSKSIGFDNDDETMNLDNDRANGRESTESILRHIRNTYDAAGLDNVFGSLDEGAKNEFILRKVHSFSIGPQPFPEGPIKEDLTVKVATLCESAPSAERDDRRLAIYVHDQSSQEVLSLLLEIKDRPFWHDRKDSPRASIPVILGTNRFTSCKDMSKIYDNGADAILLSGRGILLSPTDTLCCPLPLGSLYRNSNTLSVLPELSQTSKEVGRNRTLRPPSGSPSLDHAGISSSIDELGNDGILHRRQIKLNPRDTFVADVLTICRLILPDTSSHLVRSTWCQAYATIMQRPEYLSGTSCTAEWVALTATIFVFVIKLLGQKAKASLQVSKLAAVNGSSPLGISGRVDQRQASLPLKQPAWLWMSTQHGSASLHSRQRDTLLKVAAALADDLTDGAESAFNDSTQGPDGLDSAWRLMLALHIMREEQKLNCLSIGYAERLAPIVAQLGCWLGRAAWGFEAGGYYALEGASQAQWVFVESNSHVSMSPGLMDEPVGIFEWLEQSIKHASTEPYPTLATVAQVISGLNVSDAFAKAATRTTPRIAMISNILEQTKGLTVAPVAIVETAARHGFTTEIMETLPEAIAAPFREAIARCEKEPPTTWPSSLLKLIGREDLDIGQKMAASKKPLNMQHNTTITLSKDVQSITNSLESPLHAVKTREADRHAISQLLFSEDRRLVEATSLMHFNNVQIAECYKQPDWSDAFHFEQQRKVMQWVTTRMIALPAGDGMLHFDSQIPLMTEKYHLPGFNSSAIMQPMGHTVTTDRTGLSEEKVNWAYFHAGVSVGLRISRNAKGIDTSWLVFNKPPDLTNRHAGLLLALGLNGHLRSLAKWLSFKYLTPKHTMTSVGLLLGISASYMGTMDSLITRMLSVHITAMLPPGAAELNVSSATQTAGLMGIGLLYCNTEHRRMSELMLHEVELMEVEDVDNGPDMLRDESYRLSAGFALGLINLAKGKDLKGLHGIHLPERLLGIAVGPRPVNAVHVFDKATAGAIVAIALVYMKSGDKAVARKIDIPDTEAQFDHVRPDMLMLRSMAKHVILWDEIQAQSCEDGVPGWIHANMPKCYKAKLRNMGLSGKQRTLLTSTDVPFYNIATGLAWALSLRYAGSGSGIARDEILLLLDFFHAAKSKGDAYYYDAKLARASLRRCIDVLALAAATVMAGTGDLKTFRYLRRLHGRTDAETPYGSHFAAHLAIGVLFLGGGTYTLGTSDMAVASLICAFYPLFPTDVQDNRVHLQAFRHFWIFAAEARCVIIEDIDTHRPISMPIVVTLRDGTVTQMQAPCLLPELDLIATLQTADPAYWRVTLDFASNASHLAAFRKNQRIHVRRCPTGEAHSSIFGGALAARSTQVSPVISRQQIWDWIFSLPALREELTKADIELIIPPDVHSSVHTDDRATVIDDRLVLGDSVQSKDRNELWNLRMLFNWAEKARDDGNERLRWIGGEVVEALKAGIEARTREGY